MNFQYREGTVNDIPKLQALGIVSYGQFQHTLSPDNWHRMYTFLTAANTYPDLFQHSKCFVCVNDEELVGMAYLVPAGHPTDIFQTDWSYIRMVGVQPGYEGNGIGKKLVQLCIDHAKKTGEKVIALHTSEFMDAARHLYEKIGFKKIKELEPRFGKKYWLYLLVL
jgi:ribosomal protein S18 acetylase RimI-like enzyme